MNSLNDIWASILEQLSEKLTPTAINTWFGDCVPVDLTDNKLILQTTTDFKRRQIQGRYSETICDILSDLFSCKFEITVLLEDEVEEYKSNVAAAADTLPEALGYTFDRFIVGNSNRFAHAAAIAVAENPGKAYNPLFIYGNSGLGKTHLLLAIGHALLDRQPDLSVVYIKGDEFTNQMIQSLRENTQPEFRERFRRHVDLFLVDDIQFIAGKAAVQQEFFHTFNSIYEDGHQIVITSDRPPMEMVQLEDRLRSRFEGGLMADIQPPDLETRIAIIQNKSTSLGLLLPDEVVNYIADNITSNIRQINGVINRLTAYGQLEETININTVKRAISDVVRTGVYVPTPEVIIAETGRYFNATPEDILSQKRGKNISMARQVSMYLLRGLTNQTLIDIGKIFDRNHSTALSSIRKIEDLMKSDPEVSNAIRDITANINSKHVGGK